MLRARHRALILAATALSLTGCMRVVTVPEPPRAVATAAVLDRLALVVPVTDGLAPYVATPWHRARLTIGRHDGTMAELTHTFESTHSGLRSVGRFPALAPGAGYWIRVELVQDVGGGLERVIGRGWVGDEDEDGIALLAGGNLARLNIKPTMAGMQIALSPVRPPRPEVDDWSPRWESDVVEVSETRHAFVGLMSDGDEVEVEDDAGYEADDSAYDDSDGGSDSSSDSDSYSDSDADSDSDDTDYSSTGDFTESYSAYRTIERNR